MNQTAIGNFIEKKRKEQNLTQAQLAEKLGVSNKTVSKWENGKCMPDYGVIQPLCTELKVTVSELMDGEEQAQDSIRAYDDEQILDLIKRTQTLESQRETLVGIILIVMGHGHGPRRNVIYTRRQRCQGLLLRPHDGTILRLNASRNFCSRQIHCKTGINRQKLRLVLDIAKFAAIIQYEN